jgi:hypothetical protein
MNVTNQDLILRESNSLTHLPIFVDAVGVEYVALDGQKFVPVSTLDLSNAKRETVNRK